MAKNRKNAKEEDFDINQDKGFRRALSNINSLIGNQSRTLYGTDRTSDVDKLNETFQSLLQNQLSSLTNKNDEDITSFLNQIVSSDNKTNAADEMLNNQFLALTGDEYSTMQSFIYDAYRNKLLQQSDLHEVSSQLIELSEAILITRDAIISADVVEGRMSRSFNFENIDENEVENTKSIIETMEKRFKLLEKIKNFIIPKTLEYGEYYVYVIPYSKLFGDFMTAKEMKGYNGRIYRESTILESFNESKIHTSDKSDNDKDDLDTFLESVYEDYTIQDKTRYVKEEFKDVVKKNEIPKKEFMEDMKNILGNVSVCNDALPLPVIEESGESVEFFKEMYEKAGDTYTEAFTKTDWFNNVTDAKMTDNGIVFDKDKKEKKKKNEFEDIKDCYVKMIEPTRIIPIKIMNTIIGYYYIMDEDITPLSGAVSSTLYYTKFDEHRRERTIVDSIAERVVKSFDKPFLMKNLKFKETIVDAINYYNLNEKRLKFQFIPAEYIQSFKIDEDADGNGTSMIKKSLFYAKLYLMLLLFKIMSIILNSNDTKVNYLKQSGIDKNIANKVQEIARIKQSRQINITDLFSYTTLINKVGNGQEMYIPTGRSGERPIETEILSGQDVPLNSELLEMLKNAYILGTGVPAAIVNYLNEADFAKVIEQNNTKFLGRVVNYQLDFNSSITELYKKIMRWSTNIPENVIENFEFILQAPKTTAINTKSEIIGQFNGVVDFLVGLLYDDPAQSVTPDLGNEIREFKKIFARDQLPMIDFDQVEEMMEKAKIAYKEKKLQPNPDNGDNGDDLGLDEDLGTDEM